MEMILFSAHGEAQGQITAARALGMVRRGEAVAVWARATRNRRVMTGVRRTHGQIVRRSPAAITAGETRRAAEGDPHAAAKISEWLVTGTPAYRHAQ